MKRFTFQQQVFTGFIISLILVFGVGYNSYKSIEGLRNDAKWVDHTREVISLSNEVLTHVLNVESAQRGYIATGEERFLGQFGKFEGLAVPSIIELKKLTIDNPVQTVRIDSLKELVSAKLNFAKENIERRRKEGFSAAQEMLVSNVGLDYMNQIRLKLKEIIGEETRLLKIRENATADSTTSAIRTISLGSLLVLVIVLALFFFIQRTFRLQKEAEERLRVNNEALETLSIENERRNWILTGTSIINEKQLREQSGYTLVLVMAAAFNEGVMQETDQCIGRIQRCANWCLLSG